jgi:hypothetical protein
MAKEPLTPFQVRFAPKTLERLKNAAEANGSSIHAEIIGRLEQSLANDQVKPGSAGALKLVLDSLIDNFSWMTEGSAESEEHTHLVLNILKASTVSLLDRLGAVQDVSDDIRAMGGHAANSVWARLQSGDDTPLGQAGIALGVPGREAKP